MIFFQFLFFILCMTVSSFTISEYCKELRSEKNFFRNHSIELVVLSILTILLEVVFLLGSPIKLAIVILLNVIILSYIFKLFSKKNVKEIIEHFKEKRIFLVGGIAIAFILILSFCVKTNDNYQPNSYKISISKITEENNNYVITGKTSAPNGSKIFVLDSDLEYGSDNYASDVDSSWATVKNHKFSAYIDPSSWGIGADSEISSGKKFKLIGFALPKYDRDINHEISEDEFDELTTDVTNFSVTADSKMSKYMNKEAAKAEKNQEEAEAEVEVDNYKKDMKDDINDKLSDEISVNKVTVNGQFDTKPKSMMVSVYSSHFTENPDEDYIYIIDIIKVIKKYTPSDFDNIKVALYGKVGTPYETKFMPIQSYSLPGNVIKKVIPDNLTKDSLEEISTDHYYAKFSD
ncbi:MAG: hypothetical protein ACRCZW_15150 [Lactobacillaceae bacterium]